MAFKRLFFFLFSFFFWWDWGLNLGFTLAKQMLYCLSHISSPFFLWLFYRWGSHEQIAQVGLKLQLSQVAKITGVSHWQPAGGFFFF
jgi:hypothetical protein